MANDAQKKRSQKNSFLFRLWIGISIVFTGISAFIIFYVKRKNPKQQNKATFWAGFTCTVFGIVVVYNKIRSRKEGKHYVTNGDLSGKDKSLLDIIGVGLIVQFVGIWWDHASYLLFLIPGFIVYSFIKRLFSWLRALA